MIDLNEYSIIEKNWKYGCIWLRHDFCNTEFKTTYFRFSHKTLSVKCPKCCARRLTTSEYIEKMSKLGHLVLSCKTGKYFSVQSPPVGKENLLIHCKYGHEYHIGGRLARNGKGCPICNPTINDMVFHYASWNKYLVLTKHINELSKTDSIEFVCNHDHHFSVTIKRLLSFFPLCPECFPTLGKAPSRGKDHHISVKKHYEEFWKKMGYILKSFGKYGKTAHGTWVELECIGCGSIFHRSQWKFKKNPHCPNCLELKKGTYDYSEIDSLDVK